MSYSLEIPIISPGKNNFLTFAETANELNILTEAEYRDNLRRKTGFIAGEPADNALMNSVLKNVTSVMKGFTDFLSQYGANLSVIPTANDINNALKVAIANIMEVRIIEVITPIILDLQKQIDNYAKAYHGLPVGAIIAIACTETGLKEFLTTYTAYNVCDGTNGTIDLRDKFIMCYGTLTKAHTKGGYRSIATHIKIKDTELTADQLPPHAHEVPGTTEAFNLTKWPWGAPLGTDTYIGSSETRGYRVYSSKTGRGLGHSHEVEDDLSEKNKDKTDSNLPPYVSLIMVQKMRPY